MGDWGWVSLLGSPSSRLWALVTHHPHSLPSHLSTGPLPLLPPLTLPCHFCPVEVQDVACCTSPFPILLTGQMRTIPKGTVGEGAYGETNIAMLKGQGCLERNQITAFRRLSQHFSLLPTNSSLIFPCPLALAAVGNSLWDMLNDFLLLWLSVLLNLKIPVFISDKVVQYSVK